MSHRLMQHRRLFGVWALACLTLPTWAHDFKAGDLRLDHPYAAPTRAGLGTGAVYLRAIKNTTDQADRLLSAHTPVAASIELHHMALQDGVMRMRAVSAIELPAKTDVRLRHGMSEGHHLMLIGLKAPLKDGDRFPVTFTFERAGSHEVMVWVQTPKDSGTSAHQH
jgi:copper(I)-binding protein